MFIIMEINFKMKCFNCNKILSGYIKNNNTNVYYCNECGLKEMDKNTSHN